MIASTRTVAIVAAGLAGIHGAAAADSTFKLGTRDEIIASSRTLAHDLVAFYKGNQTGQIPGIVSMPPPQGDYYWDFAAQYWATLIDHWKLTGDESYNTIITQGLQWQRGQNNDYMPMNWTATIGNFDQCGWAMAALSAAENKFPDPPADGTPWLKLAENVLNTQVRRFRGEVEDGTCEGGLRWQIPMTNEGYNWKDTFSNGCYFTLAARLARFTGNETYATIATEAYDWLTKIGYIDTASYRVYEGAHTEKNCTDINKVQFSHSASIITLGTANMYNYTNASPEWKDRLSNLTTATLGFFFPEGVAVETACETRNTCTVDMITFKGLAHRWLAATTQAAPFTAEKITPVLRTSAEGAVKTCTGGTSGRACGFDWVGGKYEKPKSAGVGEQMGVLAAVESLLVGEAAGGSGSGSGSGSGAGAGGSGSGAGAGNGNEGGGKSGAARQGVGMVMAGVVMAGMYLVL
ncbi:family 76 glycoside hydrolase [Cercophora newfieldiana]|uniref:Mannan endo-1,6-alpha-mannosidase n=1 Tax=Cercophora newfieldiana TaxID=92897 RepID=A0AA40CMF9_9PEZI|nr:family 76 glycoside hydrolase [Cercophora newfieldiana]